MITFKDVIFNKDNKTMTIMSGSVGDYDYTNIKACEILNEKAKFHGKSEPFSVTVPTSPLPTGLFTERAFYVGLKITMKDDTILAIYTSKGPTRNNTDLAIKDTEEAKKIKKVIDQIIKKYQ